MFSSATKSAGPSGYNLTNSLRIRSSASAYLNRTPGSAGNRRTWTLSMWFKRANLSNSNEAIFSAGTAAGARMEIYFPSDQLYFGSNPTGSAWTYIQSSQVFRDPSAWYHLVFVMDTTQATASNRLKMYVNGSQITALSSSSYPALNDSGPVNNTVGHYFCRYVDNAVYADAYFAEVNFIDGQALTPSSFGSTNATTGVWQPAKYTGSYGTNGFYFPFTSIGTTNGSNTGLGKDFSGNGNWFYTNNISVTAGSTYDAMTDVPALTNSTTANYCVMNPLTGKGVLTNGNLSQAGATTNWGPNIGSMAFPASGNFYCEVYINSTTPASNGMSLGVCASSVIITTNADLKTVANTYVWQNYTTAGNNLFLNTVGSNYNSSSVYTTGQTVGISVNNGTLTFYKNGTSQGTATTGLTGDLCFIGSPYSVDNVSWNFGQQPFTYTPPTGAKNLNTYNLPTSTIVKGNSYMDATLYTGTGSSNSVTNAASFKPDLVWVKDRSRLGAHVLVDSIRGATVALSTVSTAGDNSPSFVTSINSNGFTVAANTTSDNWYTNVSGDTFVGWNWQAGQGSTSSNTSGTITSTTSVSSTSGFSIFTYTGNGITSATVGHGLGVAPAMYIVKNRTGLANDWFVYHKSLPSGYQLRLNTTSGQNQISGTINGGVGTPTSSVITFLSGTVDATNPNPNGSQMVGYAWSEIPGFSAFGSYTGNGSTDGPFIYTGFLPKFILIKASSTTGSWFVLDSSRNTYNAANLYLLPESSNAEATTSVSPVDFLSNGFKNRGSGATTNTSGTTYIYAAFAENPFKNALAR